MSRRAAYLLILFFLAVFECAAGERHRHFPLHFGVEWGPSCKILEYHHYNYLDDAIGFRVDDNAWELSAHMQAFVMGSLSADIGSKFSLSLLGGYEGVSSGRRFAPIALRASFMPCGQHADGLLVYAQGGAALRKGEKHVRQYGAGAGYRLCLSRRISLDFKLGAEASYDKPRVWDPVEEKYISPRNILRSNAWYHALRLGIGLEF